MGYDGVWRLRGQDLGHPDVFRAPLIGACAWNRGILTSSNHFGPDGNNCGRSSIYFERQHQPVGEAIIRREHSGQAGVIVSNALLVGNYTCGSLDATHEIMMIRRALLEGSTKQCIARRLFMGEMSERAVSASKREGGLALTLSGRRLSPRARSCGERRSIYGHYAATGRYRRFCTRLGLPRQTYKKRGKPGGRLRAHARSGSCIAPNHDQVGIEPPESANQWCRWIPTAQRARLLCLIPSTPLLFMGQVASSTRSLLHHLGRTSAV